MLSHLARHQRKLTDFIELAIFLVTRTKGGVRTWYSRKKPEQAKIQSRERHSRENCSQNPKTDVSCELEVQKCQYLHIWRGVRVGRGNLRSGVIMLEAAVPPYSVSDGPLETNFESIDKWRKIHKIDLRIKIILIV